MLAIKGGEALSHRAIGRAWPQVTDNDRKLMARTVMGGNYSDGRIIEETEKKLADFLGVKHCFCVANGTVSIEMILRAFGIGYGDEVILPPYTFVATLSSILYSGATPVFADIDRNTYNLSPEAAEKKITHKTKAIIAVAVAGRPVDADAFEALSKKYGIKLIIDAAQAVGAEWRGKGLCSYGDAASISCQNSKNLNSGEGGIITTESDETALAIKTMLCGGCCGDEIVTVAQENRMSAFQASVLNSQLDKLAAEMSLRSENAAYLDGRLKATGYALGCAPDPRITRDAHHLYVIRFNSGILREKGIPKGRVIEALNAEGIPVTDGYAPLYRFACINSAWTKNMIEGEIDTSELPECAAASDEEGAWLYQSVLLGDREDMDDIADAIIKVFDSIDELREDE